jgi:hypothetical protein
VHRERGGGGRRSGGTRWRWWRGAAGPVVVGAVVVGAVLALAAPAGWASPGATGSGGPGGVAGTSGGLLGDVLGAVGGLVGGDPGGTAAGGGAAGGGASGLVGALGSVVGQVAQSATRVAGGALGGVEGLVSGVTKSVGQLAGPSAGTTATGAAARAAAPAGPPPLPADPYPAGGNGYDISWPQCGGPYPPVAPVAVVGVNDGVAFSANPCYASEASWAGPALTTYLNLNAPEGSDPAAWDQGPAGVCGSGDLTCEAFNYGYQTASQSIGEAAAAGHPSRVWWLDVETANYWTSDTAVNDQVIAGALAAIRAAGDWVGIYSTAYQWGLIAGSYDPGVPVWYPTGGTAPSYQPWCQATSFAGGRVDLVQHEAGRFDGDYAC